MHQLCTFKLQVFHHNHHSIPFCTLPYSTPPNPPLPLIRKKNIYLHNRPTKEEKRKTYQCPINKMKQSKKEKQAPRDFKMRGQAQTCICHQKRKKKEKNKGERKATVKARLHKTTLKQYAKQKTTSYLYTLHVLF